MQFIGDVSPASEAEVEGFEAIHGVVLPASYRKFLLEQNGGCPLPDTFEFPGIPGGSVVNKFFPLGEQYQYNLGHMCRSLDWPEAYKLGILRIGIDTGGSGLYLVSRGINTGSILFVDREEVLRKSEPVILADSFDGFLSMLMDE